MRTMKSANGERWTTMRRSKRRTLVEISVVTVVGYLAGYAVLGYPIGWYMKTTATMPTPTQTPTPTQHDDEVDSDQLRPSPIPPTPAANAVIPDLLHFTYKFDLLTHLDVDTLTSIEKMLRANVESLVAKHPGARVVFTDDAACDVMLQRHGDDKLLAGWRGDNVGMHRGDVCRGVALYQMGGYYMDLDLLANFDVREVGWWYKTSDGVGGLGGWPPILSLHFTKYFFPAFLLKTVYKLTQYRGSNARE